MSRKENLFKEMNDDIDGIFLQIEQFRRTMEEILNEGLVDADPAKEAKLFYIQSQEEKDEARRAAKRKEKELEPSNVTGSQSVSEESSETEEDPAKRGLAKTPANKWQAAVHYTFYWFAEEIGLPDQRFDTARIEQVYYKLDYLKQQFDEVELLTATINKRESLLAVALTSFHELFKI